LSVFASIDKSSCFGGLCVKVDKSLDSHAESVDAPVLDLYRHFEGVTVLSLVTALLVFGVLCGVVLKVQELTQQHRVLSLLDRVNEVSAAWYAFREQQVSWPGDFSKNKALTMMDSEHVWSHLLQAGYLTDQVDVLMSDAVLEGDMLMRSSARCHRGPCVANGYGGLFQFHIDEQAGQPTLILGQGVPIELLYELDLRVDDGFPHIGKMRVAWGGAYEGEGAVAGADEACQHNDRCG
jgi:hypothetical protein